MLDLIYDFIDSDLWDMSAALALSGGISAVIGLLLRRETGPRRVMMWGGLGLLAAGIVFSMIFEDLLPTLPTLPEHRRLPYALSFPAYLMAISMIIYGGWRFVANSTALVADANGEGRGAPVRGYLFTEKEKRVPPGILLRNWLPGLLWMAGGFALIFVAASMQHEDHFPLGRLWALFGAGT